jgi:small subunit ribosomal protein S8e
MQWHIRRTGRLQSGRKYGRMAKKRKFERGRDFLPTLIGKKEVICNRTLGGNGKFIAARVEFANVSTKDGIKLSKIITVKENHANSQYVRSNIITKGAVIKTELGLARVTSRPGQVGSVDAVLVEEKTN